MLAPSRVYATPQQRESVRYALDIGANITDYFTNYFQLAYPLPKQVGGLALSSDNQIL